MYVSRIAIEFVQKVARDERAPASLTACSYSCSFLNRRYCNSSKERYFRLFSKSSRLSISAASRHDSLAFAPTGPGGGVGASCEVLKSIGGCWLAHMGPGNLDEAMALALPIWNCRMPLQRRCPSTRTVRRPACPESFA